MASADNFVQITGNVTADPELRFTPAGVAVANFSVACTPRVKEGDQWKDGETSFFRINVWRELAENVASSIYKGTRVLVTGRLRQRSWTTDNDEKRTVIEIEADDVTPSLKWATVKVEKAANKGGGHSSRAGNGDNRFGDEPPF